MDKDSLRGFLFEANKAGYAGGNEREWVKQDDGSTTIEFLQGNYRIHDNFFGGEPYGGRLVVFYEDKPVWMMVYYGWVEDGVAPDAVYKVLRSALAQMPKEYPFRGPHSYTESNMEYVNFWEGDIDRFMGEEQIVRDDATLYKANYMGGYVDRTPAV